MYSEQTFQRPGRWPSTPLPAFSECMFNKWKTFKLSAVPTEHEIEENTADLTDFMSVEGEDFEVGDSDSEDEELEFIDSFV